MASEDDDQNSLFGSPGPSRSPSPVLALPTTRRAAADGLSLSNIVQDTQNVGNIALPGSLHCSELPKDPLALSLSHPSAPRPPTRRRRTTAGTTPSPAPPSGASTPSSGSRASSVVTRPKKRKKPRKDVEPSRAPSIILPDTARPPPPNFLRSQMALLGTAGLVAGIKPAKMQLGASRGSTPTNPIVLDEDRETRKQIGRASSTFSRVNSVVYDETDAPRLGKRSGSLTPSLDIDPALLPTPTNGEIVATLIGQKDIFPVLQEILRLIAGQKAAEQVSATTMVSRTQQASKKRAFEAQLLGTQATTTGPRAPPVKRRRLNRVPAGAADWDVPYPFQEGEGPEEYRKMWQRVRGRQLIMQLVNLIRTAARKAATKKYFLHQEACRRSQAMPESITQPQSAESGSVPTKDVQPNSEIVEEPGRLLDEAGALQLWPSSFGAVPEPPIPQTNEMILDDLIALLLTASSTDEATVVQSACSTASGPDLLSAASASFVSATSGEDINDSLINSWMNVFQTFPIPPDGFSSVWDPLKIPGQPISSASTPNDPGSDFDIFNIPPLSLTSDMHLQSPQNLIHTTENISFMSPALSLSQHEDEQPSRNVDYDPILNSYPLPSHSAMDDVTHDSASSLISHPQPRPLPNLSQISSLTQNDPILAPAISGAEEGGGSSELTGSPSSARSSSADPCTPASATWEFAHPDVVLSPGSQLQDPSSSQGVGVGEGEEIDDDSNGQRTQGSERFTKLEKGKWKERVDTNVGEGDREDGLVGQHPVPISSHGGSPMNTTPPPLPVDPSEASQHVLEPSQEKLSKQEIIRLAKERRQQLVEELEQVKLRLWETTIEQGVLIELQKQLLP